MPTYEYKCEKCGHQFEASQRITEDPLETCTKCDGHVVRLIAATNFILKGKGWYKTDYASPSIKAESKARECSPENMGPACGTCPAKAE